MRPHIFARGLANTVINHDRFHDVIGKLNEVTSEIKSGKSLDWESLEQVGLTGNTLEWKADLIYQTFRQTKTHAPTGHFAPRKRDATSLVASIQVLEEPVREPDKRHIEQRQGPAHSRFYSGVYRLRGCVAKIRSSRSRGVTSVPPCDSGPRLTPCCRELISHYTHRDHRSESNGYRAYRIGEDANPKHFAQNTPQVGSRRPGDLRCSTNFCALFNDVFFFAIPVNPLVHRATSGGMGQYCIRLKDDRPPRLISERRLSPVSSGRSDTLGRLGPHFRWAFTTFQAISLESRRGIRNPSPCDASEHGRFSDSRAQSTKTSECAASRHTGVPR